MRIIAVINEKGGTGKTSTVINTGVALVGLGKRVLLVDLDPQASLTYAFGCDTSKGTVVDVMDSTDKVEALQTIQVILLKSEGLDIIPSCLALAKTEIGLAREQIKRESWLKDRLEGLSGYDYILLDCSPSFSCITVACLTYAKEVIIPLPLEPLALNGLKNILDNIYLVRKAYNSALKISGILPVLVNNRRTLSGEVINEIKSNVKERIFKSFIRTNVSVAEAPSFGKSVLAFKPKSNGAKDYKQFASELLEG